MCIFKTVFRLFAQNVWLNSWKRQQLKNVSWWTKVITCASSLVYQNRVVKEKPWSKIQEISITSIFYTKPLPIFLKGRRGFTVTVSCTHSAAKYRNQACDLPISGQLPCFCTTACPQNDTKTFINFFILKKIKNTVSTSLFAFLLLQIKKICNNSVFFYFSDFMFNQNCPL